ncbi:MAG: hypothetical protein Q4F71_05805 [Paracoccus sp. (in: a-proteobacteria)]|nr:hypothetical protein [Paracoccus sp. (in: a-proteobacteria)]
MKSSPAFMPLNPGPFSTAIAAVGAAAGLLLLTGLAAPAAAQDYCPAWDNEPYNIIRYTSEDLWVEQNFTFTAGGSVDMFSCMDVPGAGYVADRPDFALYYDAEDRGRTLRVKVTSSCDTTLLINDASGRWHFNDDDEGLNPGIRIANAQSGLYHVWMGTYGEQMCSGATISFETF